MKILLTGGHLSPLLAVLDELEKEKKIQLFVVSRRYSMEGSKVPSVESQVLSHRGIRVVYLTTGRFQRHLSSYTIISLLKIPTGFWQAFRQVFHIQPNVVVSFGGYLSVPIVLAAWLWRIPVITHEQSVRAGLANRINGWFAKKILLSWESSRPFFPKHKTIVVGNPVRQAVFIDNVNDPSLIEFLNYEPFMPLLYVTGGNQGSHVINQTLFQALPKLLQDYRIVHQVGRVRNDFDEAMSLRSDLPDHFRARYLPIHFIGDGDIGGVFARVGLVIGRAGANTVSEIAALGIPSLLIPIPWAQQNEQAENAQLLVSVGLSEVMPQSSLTAHSLVIKIRQIMGSLSSYQASADRAKALIHADAALRIAQIILDTQ